MVSIKPRQPMPDTVHISMANGSNTSSDSVSTLMPRLKRKPGNTVGDLSSSIRGLG